jgi:hypothetical protein
MRGFSSFVMQGAALLLLAVSAAGCGSKSADRQLDEALKELQTTRAEVGAFSGKVTIDGQLPKLGPGEALLVMMYDPNNRPTPRHPPSFTRCQPDGSFEFTTYTRGDGLPVGKYIVLFAQLKGHRGSYLPPDKLLNLYDDPDKNGQRSEFNVDLTTSGRTGQAFNLEVAGREPIENPGPTPSPGSGPEPGKRRSSPAGLSESGRLSAKERDRETHSVSSAMACRSAGSALPQLIKQSRGFPLLPILIGRPMLLTYSLSGSMPNFKYNVDTRSLTCTGLSFTNPPIASVEP